jgi:hypothetical protein
MPNKPFNENASKQHSYVNGALCTKKEFPLKKGFGVVALILFILINESTISWLLAVVVGQ